MHVIRCKRYVIKSELSTLSRDYMRLLAITYQALSVLDKKRTVSTVLFLAGVEGFEPPSDGVRARKHYF